MAQHLSLGRDGGQAIAPVLIKFGYPVGHIRAGKAETGMEGEEREERSHKSSVPRQHNWPCGFSGGQG